MTTCILDHDPAVPADIGQLCADCFSRLRSSLLELPAIATWLAANIAAGGVASGERVSGSREDPIPLRVDVLDLIGPDSRQRPRSMLARPEFLLWDEGEVAGRFDTWSEAQTAWRQAMRVAGIPMTVIDVLTTRHDRKELRELHRRDPSLIEQVDAARSRWQVRPESQLGADQAGEEAIRATLVAYAQLAHDDGGFAFPVLSTVLFDGRLLAEYRDDCEAREAARMLRWQWRRQVDPRRWQTTTAPARDGWPERAPLTSVAAWLAGHMSWLAGQDWVDGMFAEVARAGSRAHRIAPWRAEIRRDPNPCEACGNRTIVIHLAEGFSRCEQRAGGCGRRIVWDHPSPRRSA